MTVKELQKLRDQIPHELADVAGIDDLIEAQRIAERAPEPAIDFPTGQTECLSIVDEAKFLTSQILGDEANYSSLLAGVSKAIVDLKTPRGTGHPTEDEEEKVAKTALQNARKYGTLDGYQLAALEQFVEGSTGMKKYAGRLKVRRIVPPSQEDTRYRVEFDNV